MVFSNAEKIMVGLPISQNNGLKRAKKIATGATLNKPTMEPSN